MKPASKPGDMYNYRVAAYLKTSAKGVNILRLALEGLDFNVVPRSIPKENTYLNQEIPFDIVISGSESEYLCECKYHENPHALSPNSVEVKDGMLEYIAAEKYRINDIRRDGITYLFITNCPTGSLVRELSRMKTESDSVLTKYSIRLAERARQRWTNFDVSIKIKLEWIRNVLTRIVVLEIDAGTLSEASKNVTYEQEFEKIIDRISRTHPSLVPFEYRVLNTIRFSLGDGNEGALYVQKGEYFVEISKEVIDQILSRQWVKDSRFLKANHNELPFIKSCHILHHSNVSAERSMELIIEAVNDIIKRQPERPRYFVAVNPGTYDVYFADLEWFHSLTTSNVNERGLYELGKISEQLPLKVSGFVLANLVKEAMRLKAHTVVRDDLMVFPRVEDEDYLH